jgi:Flp pilus assembly protein TadD
MILSVLFPTRVLGIWTRTGGRRGAAAACVCLCLVVLGSDPGAGLLQAQERDQQAELEFRGEVTLPPRTLVSRRARLFVGLVGVSFPFRERTWADHRGRFRFKDVPAGSYTLAIYIPGVGEMLQTVEITESFADARGRVVKKFSYDRETLQERTRVVNTGVVSVRELSISRKARGEFRKAQDRLRDRKVDEAIALLKRAVELAPQFMEAMNNLGTIYFQKGEFDVAEDYFRQALAIEPEAFEPMVNLGGVLLTTGSAHEAIEFNQRAQELRPLDALANAQLGLCYFRLGEFGKALEHLQMTRDLDPAHFSNPQLTMARIYLRRSQREAALRELEEFLEQHPDSGESENVRATIEEIRESRARSTERPPF